jgi:hypothetical protein
MKQLRAFGIGIDRYGLNKGLDGKKQGLQGFKECKFCNQKTPYDKIENSIFSPTICLVCGKDNNPKSRTYEQKHSEYGDK